MTDLEAGQGQRRHKMKQRPGQRDPDAIPGLKTGLAQGQGRARRHGVEFAEADPSPRQDHRRTLRIYRSNLGDGVVNAVKSHVQVARLLVNAIYPCE